MICVPSRSACFSNSRLKRKNAVPRPNWGSLGDDGSRALPPTIAPRIAPAIVPTLYGVAFAPARSRVATPRGSARVRRRRPLHLQSSAASSIPRLTVHRPTRKGERVDFLHVHHLEGVVEFRVPKLGRDRCDQALPHIRHVGGHVVVAKNRQLLFDRAAASRPSFTSSCGLYLFFGGVICVGAPTMLTDSATIATTVWARKLASLSLLLALPEPVSSRVETV